MNPGGDGKRQCTQRLNGRTKKERFYASQCATGANQLLKVPLYVSFLCILASKESGKSVYALIVDGNRTVFFGLFVCVVCGICMVDWRKSASEGRHACWLSWLFAPFLSRFLSFTFASCCRSTKLCGYANVPRFY